MSLSDAGEAATPARPLLRQHGPLLTVLFVAIALRIALALVNYQANDNHLDVVRRIYLTGQLPMRGDCAECMQAKAWHLAVASALHLVWLPPILFAQLFNALLGALTLLILAAGILSLRVGRRLGTTAFALTAFNPELIATSVQATNDALVILFGVATFACLARALERRSSWLMAAAFACAALASVSKGNGLVALAATALAILILGLRRQLHRRQLGLAAVCLVGSLVVVAALGPWLPEYQRSGAAFSMNKAKQPFPDWFEETTALRPGVMSISSGLFRFRLLDMLEQPYMTQLATDYPLHRTSIWSLLYGQAHSLNFRRWPPAWARGDDATLLETRVALLLALLPTALVLLGFALLVRRAASGDGHLPVLVVVFAGGFLAFQIKFALDYRDFAFIKPLFLYPALATIPICYFEGYQRWVAPRRWAAALVDGVAIALSGLYIVDAALLFRTLALGPAASYQP